MVQIELKNPPKDGIRTVQFSPNDKNLLATSSWDGTIRLYKNINEDPKVYNLIVPILDICFGHERMEVIAACLDGQVQKYDFSSSSLVPLYSHQDSVKSVVYCPNLKLLVSGGWDKQLIFYAMKNGQQINVQLPGKVYSMSLKQNILVVAMSERHIWIFDLNSLDFISGTITPLQKRESSLKYQTRQVCLSDNAEFFITSSIEGRVSVDYIDTDPQIQAKKYAFRCHRKQQDQVDYVYPVNSVAFHPKYGTFLTGGSDQTVSVWDGNKRKRIKQYQFKNSIASLSFNCDGTMLAVGCSYMFENGEIDSPPDQVIVRVLEQGECMPKS